MVLQLIVRFPIHRNYCHLPLLSAVWGFGMVLYELMTLCRPYEGLPNHRMIHKIMNGDRPVIEPNKKEFIPLIAIFEDCTQLEPEKRPSPQQVKASLVEIV